MTATDNLQSELDALRTGAAIYPLTDRAFLHITGPDATRWLNGMVTNNIKDLAAGNGNYNFLLNAQGRIQGDCNLYREPGEGEPIFLLETDRAQIDTLHQLLDKFIIMDDVELAEGIPLQGTEAEAAPSGLALMGSHASEHVLRVIEGGAEDRYAAPEPGPIPESGSITYGSLEGQKIVILTQRNFGTTTFEIWCSSRWEYKELCRKLELDGIQHHSPEAVEAHRILTARPKFGQDIREKDLPQETAQNHALNFNKGCYLGQEIVERIHSRGQVHRTFTAFTLTGSLPTLPAPLEVAALNSREKAKPAGEISSAMQIGDTMYALGYARREFLETHANLTYPGGTATPRKPS
jgi:folate-binding protein YgfZ